MVVGKGMSSGVEENKAQDMEMWNRICLLVGSVALWLVSGSSEDPHTHRHVCIQK
jgi:hypothetical protein